MKSEIRIEVSTLRENGLLQNALCIASLVSRYLEGVH